MSNLRRSLRNSSSSTTKATTSTTKATTKATTTSSPTTAAAATTTTASFISAYSTNTCTSTCMHIHTNRSLTLFASNSFYSKSNTTAHTHTHHTRRASSSSATNQATTNQATTNKSVKAGSASSPTTSPTNTNSTTHSTTHSTTQHRHSNSFKYTHIPSRLLSSTRLSIMKLFKQPNTLLTNFTLFFAATLINIAAWSNIQNRNHSFTFGFVGAPLLLVDGAEIDIAETTRTTSTTTSTTASTSNQKTEMIVDTNGGTTSSTTSSTEKHHDTSNHHHHQHQHQQQSTILATSATKSHPQQQSPHESCPSYGCPLLPRDIFFDKEAQAALQTIRTLQQIQQHPPSSHEQEENEEDDDEDDDDDSNVNTNNSEESKNNESSSSSKSTSILKDPSLSLFYNEAFITNDRISDQATLTLIGYKGGSLQEQINQDRAFVISPFYVHSQDNKNSNGIHIDKKNHVMRLLGVFDGHAKLGEHVSEYSVKQLPQLLSSKLQTILQQESNTNTNQQQQQIQNAINDTFIEVDKTAPAQISGGCTASIVLQIHTQIYIANAGDSRSFIATYDKNTHETSIVYITREDKPDIPEERIRVENAGGQVYIPPPDRILLGASSRVVYVDKKTGSRNGLAMSRSIGDWAAGELGVIPNPKVDVLDIEKVVDDTVKKSKDVFKNQDLDTCKARYSSDGNEEEMKDDVMNCIQRTSTNDDVEVFAVSATDGLLDYVDVNDIAKTVAHSLYIDDSPHPLSACESLITTAASSWWQARNGRYRDDIAIAVSKLSLS